MPDEHLSDFSRSWCTALLDDPLLQPIPTASRTVHLSTGENSLLASTLANSSTVRAVQTFFKRPAIASSENEEIYMLFSLGPGVQGIAGTGHGAIIALMLDEAMGTLAAEMFGRSNIITASLDVRFKRRLDTPRVVLARAFLKGAEEGGGEVWKERRKLEILGKVEDGEGAVFADGRSVFVRLKSKL
ncbi:MAG: hypothetical protein Q9201_005557 [Fulgogasparrea decipioides]